MSFSRRLRRFAATLVAALATLLTLAVVPAVAAPGTVSGGRLDWGIKHSFLSYVTGPIAKGSWSLTGGASTVGGDTFRFHSATGSYDPESGALTAALSGGVNFKGHESNGTFALDMKLSRFTVKAGSGSGGLYADVVSKAKDTGTVSSASQVKLADLGLGGIDLRGQGGTITLSGVPATMTAAGATAFGNFYPAGTQLDPLTLSVNVKAAAEPAPSTAPTPSASAKPKPADTPSAAASSSAPPAPAETPAETPTAAASPTAAPRTEFANGALDWGVRRTFRDYVTGTIAKGGWQLEGGAADGGAFFRWTPAKGAYDPATGELTAAFTGTVRFRGMESGGAYGLDLALTSPAVKVAGGKGTLSADVSGKSPNGEAQQLTGVPLATFDAAALKPEGGLLKAAELPLALTEEGSKAFGGLYPAGTAMDPLSFAVALDPAAALPPLPDLGPAAPSASASTPATPAATPVAAASDSGSGWVPVAVVGGVLVAGAAVGTVLLVRRRRAA
ncbi:HtaA domain-containing protein [Kitasatospora sp. NPDC096147]|uniref:HtaA domain-containing protein n=1 Tax=Kitasatospora sp. NPDC096147 TaxID=3364093 RepID=UPI0037F17173